jgi:hypothetical protein
VTKVLSLAVVYDVNIIVDDVAVTSVLDGRTTDEIGAADDELAPSDGVEVAEEKKLGCYMMWIADYGSGEGNEEPTRIKTRDRT